RGVERRGAVLAELQCGDADGGDAALARAMRQFVAEAGRQPMGQWPQRFWTLLLADPGLRACAPVALELDATDGLAQLGAGPRAALLLRLAAGLEDETAAAVLGVAVPAYRLALQNALPHHPDGRADPGAWGRLREQVHRRIKTLPPPRLVRLAGSREAALTGGAEPGDARVRGADHPRACPRWLLPLLWTLLALCAAAFAATFWWRTAALLEGPGRGQTWQRMLPEEAPASRYGADAGLVAHRDFELLADPQALAASEQLGFHAWLVAQGIDAPAPAETDLRDRP
ncbi:MAG: hypothetical protein ACREPV_15335, partial [Lysobacter sp.]